MLENNYSKKRIEPLVKKFNINTETNKDFTSIINLFQNQTEYQIWAIKLVFTNVCNFDNIKYIKDWADKHSNMISSLSKNNLIAYTTTEDMFLLTREIEALNKIVFVKKCINMFNTNQKKILSNAIHINSLNHLKISHNSVFNSWYKAFNQFVKLPFTRKSKFISLCSAFDSASDIKESLFSAIKQGYAWNKEDLLAFRENNTPNSNIVYNKDNIVILDIIDFHDSRLLCGGGRTGWCLTREERYFKNYVFYDGTKKRHQYFLFNFDKPESDEIAHVGFTVSGSDGVTNAHSTKNQALVGGSTIKYHGKDIDFYDILRMYNISLSNFIKIKQNTHYDWNKGSFLNYLSTIGDYVTVIYNNDSKVVVKIINKNRFNSLIENTCIPFDALRNSSSENVYLIFDFACKYNDENAIIAICTNIDSYGIETPSYAVNLFNCGILEGNTLKNANIKLSDFIDNSKIDVEKLLHKYIDNNYENEALKLIRENPEMDVNYALNDTVPVFNAIRHDMFELFNAIISSKNFDANVEDGFGEPLLISMIYAYMSLDFGNKTKVDCMHSMIESVLLTRKLDINQQDINLDTAINVAIEEKSTLWLAKELINNPSVNVNIINDYNRSALGNAIACENIEGIKALSKRKDLVVRESDIALAKRHKINLGDYIDLKNVSVTVEDNRVTDETKYLQILASSLSN